MRSSTGLAVVILLRARVRSDYTQSFSPSVSDSVSSELKVSVVVGKNRGDRGCRSVLTHTHTHTHRQSYRLAHHYGPPQPPQRAYHFHQEEHISKNGHISHTENKSTWEVGGGFLIVTWV